MLEEQIDREYIQAVKSRDKIKSSTLNFLRAHLKNLRIEKRTEKLEDQDILSVIKKQIKQRQESIEQYAKGNRGDLVDKEQAELAILKGYLPQEIAESQLKALIDEALKEAGAQSMKDMGNVMKLVVLKVAGRADNKMVSDLVKQALSSL